MFRLLVLAWLVLCESPKYQHRYPISMIATNQLEKAVAAAPQTGEPGGNSDCAQWCAANFPNPGNVCTAPAAHGKGPCFDCGPHKTSPTEQLCGGVCSETSSDSKNCGGCGNVVRREFCIGRSMLETRYLF